MLLFIERSLVTVSWPSVTLDTALRPHTCHLHTANTHTCAACCGYYNGYYIKHSKGLLDEKPESEKVSLGVRTTVNPTVKVQPIVCSVLRTTNGIKDKLVLHLVLRTDMALANRCK